MKEQSEKNNQASENINVSLSKSSVPTDLSKYPRVKIEDEGGTEGDKRDKIPEEKISKDEKKRHQDTISLSLSKSGVPTNFSKYPTVVVEREEKKDQSPFDSTIELPHPNRSRSLGKNKHQSTSDSTIEAPRQKESKLKEHQIGQKPPTTKPTDGTIEDNSNETVQLKKELKVALRKSHKALDISKYPKVIVTDENDEGESSPKPDSRPDKKNLTLKKKPMKGQTKIAELGANSGGNEINETVRLKKGLRVALRKSARALDLSQYPKVSVDDDKNVDRSEPKSESTDKPKVKFADHVARDTTAHGNDTVELMKNLKLSLSRSAAAIDLGKYPKVPVDAPNQATPSDTDQQEHPIAKKSTESNLQTGPQEPTAKKEEKKEKTAQEKLEEKGKEGQTLFTKEKLQEKAKTPTKVETEIGKKGKEDKKEGSPQEPPKKPGMIKKPKQILTPTNITPIPKIMDPTRRRDNATVKFGAPASPFASVEEPKTDDAGEPSSDTVVLKVIKEKKKKLAGILSASQTIRLRPPSVGGLKPGSSDAPETEAAISRKTLKLKTPGSTVENEQAAPETVERRVLKLKPGVPTAKKAPQMDLSEGEKTTVRKSTSARERPSAPTAKATLKIKVPSANAGVESPKSANQGQTKQSLKIKTPGKPSPAPIPVSQGTEPAVKTGKMPIPLTKGTTSGKTLKLKAVPRAETTQQVMPPPTGTQAGKVQPQQQTVPRSSDSLKVETDIFYTISAAASLVTVGAIIYLMVSQFTALF